MQISYLTPAGETVQVGLAGLTPQKLNGITSNPIYITTPSGYTPIQGELTAGSSAAFPILGEARYFRIGFYNPGNANAVTTFRMDDSDAADDAMDSIATALAGDETAIVLLSDGTFYVVS